MIVDFISHTPRIPNSYIFNKQEIQLFEKGDLFQSVIINNIEDLQTAANCQRKFSFRGQSDQSWGISSSLERLYDAKKPILSLAEFEQVIIKEFQNKSPNLTKEFGYDPGSTEDPLAVMSFIQHYGGPTRLIDWTKSFNVALFFACFNNYKTDAAVFCLSNLIFNVVTSDINSMLSQSGYPMAPGANERLPPKLDQDKLIKWYNPNQSNPRLDNQQGHFLYPHSANEKFEPILECLWENKLSDFKNFAKEKSIPIEEIMMKAGIIKIIIPANLLQDVKNYLKKSGITANIIYPDSHGLIQSLYEI